MSPSHKITRRMLLASAAALPAPYVNAAHLSADAQDDQLHQLMAAWRSEYDALSVGADGDMDMTALYDIERAAAAIRPTSLAGFAIKLLILTNYGEHDLDGPAAGLVAEAEAISGIAPPATFKRGA